LRKLSVARKNTYYKEKVCNNEGYVMHTAHRIYYSCNRSIRQIACNRIREHARVIGKLPRFLDKQYRWKGNWFQASPTARRNLYNFEKQQNVDKRRCSVVIDNHLTIGSKSIGKTGNSIYDIIMSNIFSL